MCRSRLKHLKIDKGFTLIELLVVISIISLLLSILVPSLRKARQQAKATACKSNLRQYNLGFQLYGENNDRCLPVYRVVGTDWKWRGWWHAVLPYLSRDGDKIIISCPSFNDSQILDICLPGTEAVYTGYMYNAWLKGNLIPPIYLLNYASIKIDSVKKAKKTPILWDDTHMYQGGYNAYGGFPLHEGTSGSGNYYDFDFRHGDKFNVLMVDGHSETLEKVKVKNGTRRIDAFDYPSYNWKPDIWGGN